MGIKIKIKSKSKFVIKVKKPDVIGDVVPQDEDDEISLLEKQIKDMKKKKVANKNKKKMEKEIMSPSAQMKMFHSPWVKDINVAFKEYPQFKLTTQSDIDRVDISSAERDKKGWRICIVGLHNKQVDISLFFEGEPDFMEPQISFLNMPEEKAKDMVFELITLKDEFVDKMLS